MTAVLSAAGWILLASVPLVLTVTALLDAARRPEWAFAFVGRSRTRWVATLGAGVLVCGLGVVAALWYLVRVRPQVAGVEAGRLS